MRRTTIPTALAVLVLLAGCGGGDDDPEADPSGGGTPSATTSEPGEPSPTEPSGEPSTAPASGPALDMPNSRVRVPEGWKVGGVSTRFEEGASSPDYQAGVSLGETPDIGSQAPSAEEAGQIRIDSNIWPQEPKLVGVVDVAGQEMYHVEGRVSKVDYTVEFGASHNDVLVSLVFLFKPDSTRAERQAVIDPVLASFEWK